MPDKKAHPKKYDKNLLKAIKRTSFKVPLFLFSLIIVLLGFCFFMNKLINHP